MEPQFSYPACGQLLTWGLGQQEVVNIFLLVAMELLVGFLNLIGEIFIPQRQGWGSSNYEEFNMHLVPYI